MDQIAKKYPLWKRVLHKFQARREIPFRRRFFVGYDLHGNTYWEFTPDGNMRRLRRKLEPWRETLFKVDHFSTVPPKWLQWLRRTREMPPTLQELIDDKIRQQRIKLLAQQADQKWLMKKARLEQEQQLKFQAELGRVETEKAELERQNAQNMAQYEEAATGAEDPYAAAAESAGKDPIVSANIKPRK
ncbi:hypothetical protein METBISCDRAFT_25696 [Metschnikowia bicuspidata]|uniref:NADH dehydrogenase [ubiquinone] 1 alpha subcomplex subunit n=1 Tax=Metschnikowia bicuspidata TaxID=27322 RepID=A0A4P9ZHL4_9ASCO|nr:hypothetical protein METBISCDRAFT_25696 [Metschnikowia bicuspidata]